MNESQPHDGRRIRNKDAYSLGLQEPFRFRSVDWWDDFDLLFDWRSDPGSIESTIGHNLVTRREHEQWMNSVALDPRRKRLLAIAEWPVRKLEPVGLVTTTATQYGIDLAWMIAPEWRGKGLGKLMVQSMVKSLSPAPVYAFIRWDNEASIHCARFAGLNAPARLEMYEHFFNRNPGTVRGEWMAFAKNLPESPDAAPSP